MTLLRRILAVGTSVALVVLASSPAQAYPRPGRTVLASEGVDSPSNYTELLPALTPDGRFVAFVSEADGVVPGDTNGFFDIFVRDLANGQTEMVSVSLDGVPGNGQSHGPSISADGRFVAFQSDASNLVTGDGNNRHDVFVHDRATGTTEIVSVSDAGEEGEQYSAAPSISGDGRYVAFESASRNFVPRQVLGFAIWVHDRVEGTIELVSVSSAEAEADSHSFNAAISQDGRSVAFESYASNLVASDGNGVADIFVRDLAAGTTERVSFAEGGLETGNHSLASSISADGRVVAFENSDLTLVPADANQAIDVFVYDRDARSTERVSVSSAGVEGNSYSYLSSLSADGRHVAFVSWATNLAPGDTGNTWDVYVHDRTAGTTERVAVVDYETGLGFLPAISGDGRYVAFTSAADDLVPGDDDGTSDLFVRDRGPVLGVGELGVSEDGAAATGWATFSGGPIAAGTDPTGDAGLAAGRMGADLTGASVSLRPEHGSLLLRLHLESMPSGPLVLSSGPGGLPPVLYGAELRVGATTYQIRALTVAAQSPPAIPYFGLLRCDPSCVEVQRLSGAIGHAGRQVTVSVPLTALGAAGGAPLSALRAFTALGQTATGPVVALDEMPLPDAALATPSVQIGVAPADTPEEDVAFDTDAALSGGAFTAPIGEPQEGSAVWARACLGSTCSTATARAL